VNLDTLKELHHKKGREAQRRYLLEGEHLVLELQRAAERDPRLRAAEIYITHERGTWPGTLTTHVINARHMAQLSETRSAQGIVAVVPMLPPATPRADERVICLHEIQDPGNLGTILRTLAWFGHFRCLLTPQSVDPYNAKVLRAAMGAHFHVPVEIDVPLDSLSARFSRIARLETHGVSIQSPEFRDYPCYLFGNEARGLPADITPALQSAAFTIPGSGAVESLNLATAVNLCAYELVRG
jgi:TrmH family RNA methyltransferase